MKIPVESIEYDESGKYIILSTNEGGYSCTIMYTPGGDGASCEVLSDHTLWHKVNAQGEAVAVKKVGSSEDLEKHMTEYVFEGIKGIDFKDDDAYAEINGVNYKIEVLSDIAEFAAMPCLHNGAVRLTPAYGGKIDVMFYIYEEGKITFVDFEDNVTAVFKA